MQITVTGEESLLKGEIFTLRRELDPSSIKSEMTINLNAQAKGEFYFKERDEAKITFSAQGSSYKGEMFFEETSNIGLTASAKSQIDVNLSQVESTKSEGIVNGSTFLGRVTLGDSAKSTLDFQDSKGYFDISLKGSSVFDLISHNSHLKGIYHIEGSGDCQSSTFTFTRSKADLKIDVDGFSTLDFTFKEESQANLGVNFVGGKPLKADFKIDGSKMHASFTQKATDFAKVKLSNNSTWFLAGNPKIHTLEIDSTNRVDFLIQDFSEIQRSLEKIDATNRRTLHADTIIGNGGNFNLYGILKREAWSKNGNETIATDQIITKNLNGNHNITIAWDPKNIDNTLLQANPYEDYIVVAKQINNAELKGDFRGAKSSLGVFEYDIQLTRITLKDETGRVMGYN